MSNSTPLIVALFNAATMLPDNAHVFNPTPENICQIVNCVSYQTIAQCNAATTAEGNSVLLVEMGTYGGLIFIADNDAMDSWTLYAPIWFSATGIDIAGVVTEDRYKVINLPANQWESHLVNIGNIHETTDGVDNITKVYNVVRCGDTLC